MNAEGLGGPDFVPPFAAEDFDDVRLFDGRQLVRLGRL